MGAVNSELGETTPLRVHFFVNFVHPFGTYFRFHNLAIGLTRLGHHVTVFAGDLNYRSRSRREVRDGVSYQIIPETFLVRALGFHCDPISWARRYAQSYPPCDVAHLFQPFPSATAAWLRAGTRVRFYDWDDLWSGGLMSGQVVRRRDHWPRMLVRFMERRLPRWTDHVTAISQFLATLAQERGARAVTLLHSGSWPADASDKAATRARLGLRADAFYSGFMGRTTAELPWCFDALAKSADRYPATRLALCGMPASELDGLPPDVRRRIDYLGQLPPAVAKDFAACLDLGLLPMKENKFNLSRLPQKFGDHVASGVPLLCSTVGECGLLAPLFPWVLPAGTTRAEWVNSFGEAVGRVSRGDVPAFDPQLCHEHVSWAGLSHALVQAYRAALAGRPSGGTPNDPLTMSPVPLHATN
jgi:glycosyltransferase involved in cell wall biosynthesis